MSSLIAGATPTMSSREIADLVESRHDDVKRSVYRLAERRVITLPPLAEVQNPGPGPRMVTEFRICKRDSYVIVAQLSHLAPHQLNPLLQAFRPAGNAGHGPSWFSNVTYSPR